ncbi:DEAD/DEAH box helicase [Roseateles sp. DXS20W]|uniref:DEAD/DEAH box helicase n=1 Tax=Pelomonas lactea TaxID=3299030 RepID=A0ABW7GQZ1_9BURK
MSSLAADLRWLKALAGPEFRRADTLRDERGAEGDQKLERWLRDVAGWLPVRSESAASVAALSAAIAAQPLRDAEDEAVVRQLLDAMAALRAAPHDGAALARALGAVGEAARRRLGLWPHPVQFAGARLLITGQLAEMRTGEGKTLVAALAATVMAASGARVHVVSTNDYLAQRDCEEMAPLFAFFGLAGGFVKGGMEPDERRTAYRHAVCYVSGKELVFDYLKDRLAGHGLLPGRVAGLRGFVRGESAEPLIPALHFAIVDEADSVLIDEARTPMIISQESEGIHEPALLAWAIAAARELREGQHFTLKLATREVELKPGALDACPPLPDGVRPVWRARPWREQLLRQALTALHFYERDQHYILAPGEKPEEGLKVQIVDESTGRVMADRSWEQGLHQLIEAKEGVKLTAGRDTLARMTFQRFFRRYYLLAGLTGTAAEAARELWATYRLRVRRLPTNKPIQRRELPPAVLPDAAAKWQAVADEAMAAAARGQAVLVGTRSVEASEAVAAVFTARGVEATVLNARQDAEEAAIVSRAGASGRITIATNMAGRGTDIKPDAQALAAGGLHVVLTEFHESPRVDRQLFGRSGRQGQPGTVRALVAADDPLFKTLPPALRAALARGQGLALAVRLAQRDAERRAWQMRKQTLRQDRELHRIIGIAGSTT